PVAAKRNVNPDVMTGSANDIPQLVVNSKQHLKLIGGGRKLQVADDAESFPDHQLVMSGDAYVRPIAKQFLEDVDVIAIDDPHVPIGNATWLDVHPFAQAVIRL